MAKTITVFDVAAYILRQQSPKEMGGVLTAWKLHKLVYYAQAWSTVWDDEVLFHETIMAWSNGPVVPTLYKGHGGAFKLVCLPMGKPEALSSAQRDTIDKVLAFYGPRSSQYLTELVLQERPWRAARARAKLPPGERGAARISPNAMAEYYGGLAA